MYRGVNPSLVKEADFVDRLHSKYDPVATRRWG